MGTVIERRRESAFTLIELLVVLAMFGVMLGLAALSAVPDQGAKLKRDAERLQALFALAAEEAQLRARPLAWQADTQGYGFLEGGAGGWHALNGDDEFRRRTWDAGAVRVVLEGPVAAEAKQGEGGVTVIEFSRDGIQRPFVLHLALAQTESAAGGWKLRRDGRGRMAIDAQN